MNRRYNGSCLCKEVTFSVSDFSQQVANCHCTMCRKFHGAAFGTLVQVKGLTWNSGEEYIRQYKASNGTVRSFCAQCGSSIGFQSAKDSSGDIEIAISLFDEDIPVKVDAQIFTKNKANWCKLYEELPSYKESRG